jgi:hypothetical protein
MAASAVRWMRDSRFVFTGTIESSGSSSLSAVPASAGTAVVLVERIHHAPAPLLDQTGERVTIESGDGSVGHDGGTRRVFFTNPMLYGETLALREVGSFEAPDDLDGVHDIVLTAIADMSESELVSHLAASDAVVAGRVTAVQQASETPPALRSEHDPDWHVAVIRVRLSLRGAHRGDLRARFPASRDIRWYRVPKPRRGDEGIFVLHEDGLQVGDAALVLLHPEDFHPLDELERLQRHLDG